jgi:excisionase family DNA binding protein
MHATVKNTKRSGTVLVSLDMLSQVAELIAEKIPKGTLDKASLSKALHDVLDARDDRGRMARKQIQMHILEVNERLAYGHSAKPEGRLLSTEQAAQMMMKSRPHVAMLIDAGELEGASTTPKGHRRVPESSVRAWLSKQGKDAKTGSSDYKAAAREAGMYAIAESTYVEAAAPGRGRV